MKHHKENETQKKCYGASQKKVQYHKSGIRQKVQYEKNATREKCNAKKGAT